MANGADTKARLLDAALHEFSAHGYEGASVTRIADRAATHQPQVNYHFGSKQALWRAAVDELFVRLDAAMASAPPWPGHPSVSARPEVQSFAGELWRFAWTASSLPELNRLMVHEAAGGSERLAWLVDRHVRRRFELLSDRYAEMAAAGHAVPASRGIPYYAVVGAASLLGVNRAEAELLGVDDPSAADARAEHALFVVRLVLGPPTATPVR